MAHMQTTQMLTSTLLGTPIWAWTVFAAIVIVLLVLDLGLLHRTDRPISSAESLVLSAGYITVALLFGVGVWLQLGPQAGIDYYTAFLVEKSLSMDNVFVIAMVFSVLAIPPQLQYRVLFWGILGVIVMRGVLIGLGAALVAQFSWLLYGFGAFLIYTGVQMWRFADHQHDLSGSALLNWLRNHLRLSNGLRGNRFWVREPAADGSGLRLHATPLLLALLLVELFDLVFAVDSVPATFAITTDPFIVYTSNIFAILGLRALYFALAALVERFRYLKYALALVLVFIGTKIFLVSWLGKFPPLLSLSITAGLLAGGVIWSLWKTRGAALAK
jgi:tellurite resistance protein TerC